jgi:succinate-semialdehyde dehydrogenase/glutarate-semialdehyde dehydrogenase
MPIESRNPATGELVETFAALDAAGIEARLARAATALAAWRRVTPDERAQQL